MAERRAPARSKAAPAKAVAAKAVAPKAVAPKATDAESGGSYKAPALDKGLDILELVAAAAVPQGLAQIAEQLGRSKSEIFRMLRTLEARGYLHRDDADRYALTPKLFELAMTAPPVADLVAEAMPVMRRFSAQARQSCHLAVVGGAQIVVVARVESPADLGFSVRVGYHRDLVESGSGRVLLAFANPEERQLRLGGKPVPKTLERTCRGIVGRGYERAPSAAVAGVTDIACPVFDGVSPGAIASLTVPFVRTAGGPSDLEAVTAALRAAADELSAGLTAKAGR